MSIGGAQTSGLWEMTPDISKLVNLKELFLTGNSMLTYIPESISCLQKLECFILEESPVLEVPAGLATLANLACLDIIACERMAFPSDLQVNDRIDSQHWPWSSRNGNNGTHVASKGSCVIVVF
jgi:hypothetical protein